MLKKIMGVDMEKERVEFLKTILESKRHNVTKLKISG